MKHVTIVILLSLLISGCCKLRNDCCEDKKINVSGQVVDYDKMPLADAEITIYYVDECDKKANSIQIATNSEGEFESTVLRSNSYVVNVKKKNYGFSSRTFSDSTALEEIPYTTYYLNKATVVSIDANEGGTVVVENTESLGTASSNADWSQSQTGTLPIVIDSEGRVTGFTMPPTLKSMWETQLNNEVSLSPASLTIPGNALVNSNGQAASGQVSVQISAIDLYAPNGMPGNNEAISASGEDGFMESFGAIAVEIYNEEEQFNLNEKTKATASLIMPIPEWQLKIGKDFPTSVPLLYFNETKGIWEEDGRAVLDSTIMAYRAELNHFSAINFDLIKSGPSANAAFKFAVTTDTNGDQVPSPFRLNVPFIAEVTTPGFQVTSREIDFVNYGNNLCETLSPVPSDDTGGEVFQYGISLNRLPTEAPVAVAFIDANTDASRALYVLKTREGHQDITDNRFGTVDPCRQIDRADDPAYEDTYSNLLLISPGQFIDEISGNLGDTLVAVCSDGSNYRISIASTDLTFNPTSPAVGEGIDINFIKNFGEASQCNMYFEKSDIALQFTLESETTWGTAASPEWKVFTYTILKSNIHCDAALTHEFFAVDVGPSSYFDGYKSRYSIEVGECVF